MAICENFYALRGISRLYDWQRLCVRKRTHRRIQQLPLESPARVQLELQLYQFNSNSNLPLSFMTDFQPI